MLATAYQEHFDLRNEKAPTTATAEAAATKRGAAKGTLGATSP